jgi:hypothetical protein
VSGRGRLAVCLVPVAAGAVAVVVLLLVPHGPSKTAAACPPLHAPVPAAARRVLAAYAGRIEFSFDRSTDGSREEMWSDPLTGRYRQLSRDSGGRITDEFATVEQGRWETTYWVTFDDRIWILERSRRPRLLSAFRPRNDAALDAQGNRDVVLHGMALVLGTEVVDGRPTLHLREIVPARKLPPPKLPPGIKLPARLLHPTFPSLRIDTWVDPFTYLTVRTRTTSRGNSTISEKRWLNRTRANVALTHVVIPAGFRRETPTREDAWSSGKLLEITGKRSSCSQS